MGDEGHKGRRSRGRGTTEDGAPGPGTTEGRAPGAGNHKVGRGPGRNEDNLGDPGREPRQVGLAPGRPGGPGRTTREGPDTAPVQFEL